MVTTYFILCRSSTPPLVKIGKTENLKRRIERLRTLNAAPIELLAVVPHKEEDLHARFRGPTRHHGEWFKVSGDLVEYLEEVSLTDAANILKGLL